MRNKKLLANVLLFACMMTISSCKKDPVSPSIQTLDVTEILENSAKCGGNITENGMAFIKQRGVCWSSESWFPTISDSKTTDGNGDGLFQTIIGGLEANTTYYIRAYAKNEAGISYGEMKTFTTKEYPMSEATVSTSNVLSITNTSASCGGNVTADGNSVVTAKGVCWNTSDNPTLSDSHTNDGKGIGTFISSITGLTAGTKYFVRSYATNSVGTVYGETKTFETTSGGGGGTITPLNDYIGTYSVSAYNWDTETYESWSGTEITTFYNSTTSSTWVKVLGVTDGAGYEYFHALGEYDASTGAIHLYGGWYLNNNTFYFNSNPNVYYYSVFFPIYAQDSDNTFYYIADGNGCQDTPEMYLTKNANGTFSLTGADYNDSNGRKATGFCLDYYKDSDDSYAGRFYVYTHYTMTKTSKEVGASPKNHAPVNIMKVPNKMDNYRRRLNDLYYRNTKRYGR